MSVQVIAPAMAGEPSRRRACVAPVVASRRGRSHGHFSTDHALARVARTRCEQAHAVPMSVRLGKVACGACWEFVIRTDERVAIEFELPPLTGDDASIVDEVAVARAVRGERMRLNRAEKARAIAMMAAAGRSAFEISVRLRMNMSEVGKLWPAAATAGADGQVAR